MSKFQKTLIGSVVGLIILNMVLLALIWLDRPHAPSKRRNHLRGRPEVSAPMLHRQLDLTTDQKQAFKQYFREHRKHMRNLHQEFRLRKLKINQAIIKGDSGALRAENKLLFATQQDMEKETQKLTAELASICTEEQKERFLKTMEKVLRENQTDE